jgi:hypothetical protein
MTKKIKGGAVYMPMDVLKIDANQRYNSKLSDTQTSNMIKFAVTLPKERWAAVEQGVRLLDWQNDPYLKHYGLKVNPAPAKVKARVLPSPAVHFGQGSKEAQLKPADMIAGRWRLDGHVNPFTSAFEHANTIQAQVCDEQQGPPNQGLGCLLHPRHVVTIRTACETYTDFASQAAALRLCQPSRLSSRASSRSTSRTEDSSLLTRRMARSHGWVLATLLMAER